MNPRGPNRNASPRDEELLQLLSEIDYAVEGYVRQRVETHGVTLPQARVLYALDREVSMTELATRVLCDASNLTGIIDRLEARKLVQRRTPPADRRMKVLGLTQAGQALRTELLTVALDVPAFAGLSQLERRKLFDLLALVAARARAAADGVLRPAAGPALRRRRVVAPN